MLLLIIVAYIRIQTLTCTTVVDGGNLSRQIQLLLLLDCLACVFLESDHSIFFSPSFSFGKINPWTGSKLFSSRRRQRKSIGKTLSRQWDIDTEKKNLHKSIPIQVNVGSPEKRQSAQARAWMPGSKGNAPFIPTFFILSPSTQKLGYKSQSSWKRGVAPREYENAKKVSLDILAGLPTYVRNKITTYLCKK